MIAQANAVVGGKRPLLFLAVAVVLMVTASIMLAGRTFQFPIAHVKFEVLILLALAPMALAVLFTLVESGGRGVASLFGRLLPTRRIGLAWYAVSIFLLPIVAFGAYGVALAMGQHFDRYTPLSTLALLAPALVLAIGEEVGWTGYATDAVQQRYGALPASLIVGGVAIALHFFPYAHAGYSPIWLAAQLGHLIVGRVVVVWVFNNTSKSILPAVLLHASYNTSYIMYPANGSHYDPVVWASIQAAIALAVIVATRGTLGLRARVH